MEALAKEIPEVILDIEGEYGPGTETARAVRQYQAGQLRAVGYREAYDPEWGLRVRTFCPDEWKNIPAGSVVPDGYGGEIRAPEAPGKYDLHEIASLGNLHIGWEWVKAESGPEEPDGRRKDYEDAHTNDWKV